MDETKHFIEVWGDGYLASDLGEKLTCTEVEALASLLLSLGAGEAAARWIEYHAEGDDCGDMHCRCDDEECKAEREG
ncbi:hypothetical protein SEA_KALNOKY_83 [Mycobacterium phage Kalnoky]|nr:hypothetical protein SEA_OLANP_81 [Mycobacterium phage OlanP]AXH44129.1 hypothetical protein SEA_KALNOKY_83 [Mycobacterium phage Kalnoky]AXH44537.1 hypothetical protein SEA_MARIUS_83 [Mycobacterium phage Marius]AXH44707.1 hypothetical protein SEA_PHISHRPHRIENDS_79 [Mycobacterium phage PhishRPhriends]AXH44854.1 hypothetical protein SEA_REBA_78 [Mycobacterium phage Reba]QAY03006.1 hypothetical protein SEA_GEMMA_80 [Mycobacterium phage Gemma]QBP32376.1 hypothetical protein SEA_HELIOSOLES_80 [